MIDITRTVFRIGIKPNYENRVGFRTLITEATSAKLENGFLVLYNRDSITQLIPLEWVQVMLSVIK